MAKSAQIRMDDKIHSKITNYAKKNKITIPDAVNQILKNYFKFNKNKDDVLLSKDEVKEVFEQCMNNFK